jgi:FkbM family methyltransferase
VRGQSFRGFKLKRFSEIQEIYGKDFCILLSFATRIDSVIKNIYELDAQYEMYVPNFPVFGERIYFDYNYYAEHRKEIESVYGLLADDESRSVYENAINFNITGRLEYLKQIEQMELKTEPDIYDVTYYVDVGAYDGDTIFEVLSRAGANNIKKIWAFEPDKKNFARLLKKTAEIPEVAAICELYNIGAWSHSEKLCFKAQSNRNSNVDASGEMWIQADSIDNVLLDKIKIKISGVPEISGKVLIKYDVEGAEYEALTGTRGIIQKYSPNLAVSLYHKAGDIFRLPLYIHGINPNYKFYLRKHKYIPCWDLNLYAVDSQ